MKKIFLLITFVFALNGIYAQETREQRELLDKMSDEACVLLQKIDLTKEQTKDGLTMELGLAIVPVYEKYSDQIRKAFGYSTSSSEDLRLIGEKLGANLVLKCDKMMQITKILLGDEEFKKEVTERISNKKNKLSVKGQVTKIESDNLYNIFITTEEGDVIKLAYMFDVNNSGKIPEIFKSKSKKQVVIAYTQEYIYSPEEKAFKAVKVINSFEEL